ncbi:MAG: diguanylate cyclase [Gammaproteobacteria bacterium]|nr:diguanylate cyclase [Gammaproteobacteria bacterium]
MDPTPFAQAARELRQRFLSLLDSLSAVRALTELDCCQRSDARPLLVGALEALMQHQDFARCSVFLLQDGELACAAGRDYTETAREAAEGLPPDQVYAPRRFRIGEGVVGLAAETRQIQVCPDCATDPRFVPLREWHLQVIAVYCAVLGHMLANHRAMHRLETVVAERTRQLESALAEAEQLKRRYEELSTVDELTGLHNRRFFFAEAEAAVARSLRYRHPFCMMLVDLDFFKQINDSFGHAIGDAALRDLAAALRRHTREGDILARFGGEEFVLALPNTGLEGARVLAERIQDYVRGLLWEAEGVSFGLTVSIGLSCVDHDGRHQGRPLVDHLLRQADKALYYCKANGRDQVFAHSDLPERQRAAGMR